ncbi:MAG: cytochrome d ubiquinol oxidase subunit II [Pseudomonadota bacterium]
MELPIDYMTLRVIWWALMGVLLIGFTITDGFDLGVATLLPAVARTDAERRMVINTVGPTWEGNQVWFILGGGAIFAAWPFVYAVSFSGFYLAMFLVLAALILRPVGFKYRSKRESREWRACWDWALFAGGFIPALVFGVAVGNVLQGAPFRLDGDLRTTYEGAFFGLFTPFTLLCGLLSVSMVAMHGAAWLSMRAELGVVSDRARAIGLAAGVASIVLFAAGYCFVRFGDMGFHVIADGGVAAPSNPAHTLSEPAPGAWLNNFSIWPWLWAAPALGFIGALISLAGLSGRKSVLAFSGSSIAALGIISTVGVSMFPFILPSTVDAHSSLTVWNASSSHFTLFLMLCVTIVFLPIVLAYTAWVYRVLWGRSTVGALNTNPDLY